LTDARNKSEGMTSLVNMISYPESIAFNAKKKIKRKVEGMNEKKGKGVKMTEKNAAGRAHSDNGIGLMGRALYRYLLVAAINAHDRVRCS